MCLILKLTRPLKYSRDHDLSEVLACERGSTSSEVCGLVERVVLLHAQCVAVSDCRGYLIAMIKSLPFDIDLM